jgi:hypothetical protein
LKPLYGEHDIKSWSTLSLPQDAARSFDHLVGTGERSGREGDAKGLRGLEVDDKLELGGLLDGEVGGRGALQDLVDVDRGAPSEIRETRTIGEQAAGLHPIIRCIHGGQTLLHREVGRLLRVKRREWVRQHEQGLGPLGYDGRERPSEILGLPNLG